MTAIVADDVRLRAGLRALAEMSLEHGRDTVMDVFAGLFPNVDLDRLEVAWDRLADAYSQLVGWECGRLSPENFGDFGRCSEDEARFHVRDVVDTEFFDAIDAAVRLGQVQCDRAGGWS